MSGKVGSECDLWIDLRLKLILVVQGSRSSCGWYKDLVRLVDHFDQAVGRRGVVGCDGIGHSPLQ